MVHKDYPRHMDLYIVGFDKLYIVGSHHLVHSQLIEQAQLVVRLEFEIMHIEKVQSKV